MVNAAGGDEMAARKMFCGLEAEVTTPDGRTATLYVGESFRCREPFSRCRKPFFVHLRCIYRFRLADVFVRSRS